MFRILCKFKPHLKRADGGTRSGKPRQRRKGAWVVLRSWRSIPHPNEQFMQIEGCLVVQSHKERQPGTRVSPIALLREWQKFKKTWFVPFRGVGNA